jgi:carbon monoxide dehydrogenase subunit G
MKLEQSFEVDAPIDEVWGALIDLERVAPCLPGAAITGHDEDGTYHGEFKVKLGPTTASYRGTVKIEEMDEAAHCATMRAKGTDKRGQGGAQASIVNTLVDLGGRTRVEAVTDYTITGRLASFGRGGMIQDISNRLLGDFSNCLQAQLGPQAEAVAPAPAAAAPQGAEGAEATQTPPAPAPRPAPQPSKPINGFALVLGVLRTRLADLLEALAKRLRS